MFRTLAVGATVALSLVGCVTVDAPTSAPTAGRTFNIMTPVPVATSSPAASVASTASPVAPPTAAPTPSPTPADLPTALPPISPSAGPASTPDPSQGDLLFADEMDDPTSGWAVGELGVATISFGTDVLNFSIGSAQNSAWTPRSLGDDYGVVLVAGVFEAAADGGFGLLCSGADGVYYGAVVTTERNLVFFSIDAGATTVLERHDDLDLDVVAGQRLSFGLECGATSTGALRLVPFLFETGPLAVFQSVGEGPESFNRVALYAEAFEDNFSLDVDIAAAYGQPGSAEGMTAEAEQLLGHVPDIWSEQCYEVPVTEDALAIIHCVLQTDGAGPELASYELYATNTGMDEQFDENVERYGVESTGDCAEGPNETTWNIDDVEYGRLLCAPQKHGIRFDWTDDRLGIFSTLVDFEGDYETTYDAWVEAGPIL